MYTNKQTHKHIIATDSKLDIDIEQRLDDHRTDASQQCELVLVEDLVELRRFFECRCRCCLGASILVHDQYLIRFIGLENLLEKLHDLS